jgi:hypothetical protein
MQVPKSDTSSERKHEKRLFAYALAAGAGMLAAGAPAEAGVIYVNPPDHTYTNTGFQLDLNSDGSPDVTFTTAARWVTYSWYMRQLRVGANGVVAPGFQVSPLPADYSVGPAAPFGASGLMAAVSYYRYYGGRYIWGPWANVRDGYLGLRFLIGPNTHYGWVRMDVSVNADLLTISATVKDWAYDSTPGAGIRAGDTGLVPEPGTLSLLALGSAGLALWRKRKAQSRAA